MFIEFVISIASSTEDFVLHFQINNGSTGNLRNGEYPFYVGGSDKVSVLFTRIGNIETRVKLGALDGEIEVDIDV